jgi:hypothetical protein
VIVRELVGLACAAAGLLLPGLGWARAARWPLPWLGAGLLSALAILAGVLGFTTAGIPVTFPSLGLWLVLVAVPGWLKARGVEQPADEVRPDWWLALPVLPLVFVAVWHACLHPLTGADAGFRWNLLAELLVEQGNLDFYPPTTTADFRQYFWADGINPLVASVYAWTYLAMGSTMPTWTALPVLAQVAGLLGLLFGLGQHWGGARGGWFACALGGLTMLLQFAFNLGQETGLTTLGAGSMVLYLVKWRETRATPLLVAAAVGAAVVACAREYGAVAAMAGTAWIFFQGRAWRAALGFACGAGALPLLWHGRVFLLTGNPMYAQDFAGFPTNAVFDAWMKNYQAIYGDQLRHAATWQELLRLVCVTALPAVLGLGAGLVGQRKQAGWGLVAAVAAVFVAVWYASIPYTAGGLFYSMRVLGPVLLLGCAWGGACVARWVPGRAHLAGVMIGLTLFACDASLRAWTIPQNPYTLPPRAWPGAGYQLHDDFERENTPFLREVARFVPGRVLSDSAGLRGFFQREGKSYSPLWTPELAWLFVGDAQPDAAARLRAQGFSHLLLKRMSISFDFLRDRGVLASLDGHLRVVMSNPTFVLLEVTEHPTRSGGGHE